jgi:hypothetical protein
MTTSPPNTTKFDSVLDEHRHLRDLIRLLQLSMLHPRPSSVVMQRLLDELDAALRTHFEHEEHGGYLHDAVSAAPRLSMLAVRLLEEHADFLAATVVLRRLCNAAAESGDWSEFADAYARFCHRFNEHEMAENHLVQDAMLRDMPAED